MDVQQEKLWPRVVVVDLLPDVYCEKQALQNYPTFIGERFLTRLLCNYTGETVKFSDKKNIYVCVHNSASLLMVYL